MCISSAISTIFPMHILILIFRKLIIYIVISPGFILNNHLVILIMHIYIIIIISECELFEQPYILQMGHCLHYWGI